MMYKISLYPEYHLKRRAAKAHLLRRVLLWSLVCVEGILLVSLLVSLTLLREQIRSLRAAIPQLEQQLQATSQPQPALDLAQEMLRIRSRRTEWAPALAALSERIVPSLRLRRVEGEATLAKNPARLECEGVIRQGGGQLEDVTRFITALRADPRMTGPFPTIRLGTIRAGGTDNFLVIGEGKESGVP
jgi:hypothetical protein